MKKETKEANLQYSPIEDTAKVKKIISILMDKISKGNLNQGWAYDVFDEYNSMMFFLRMYYYGL